jgi:hypothetical protein
VTDRQFAECCYGTRHQHAPYQDCPLTLHFDNWTNSWRDRYNDVFVVRRAERKMWEVAERGPGNQTILHSRHRDLELAKVAAQAIIADRLAA